MGYINMRGKLVKKVKVTSPHPIPSTISPNNLSTYPPCPLCGRVPEWSAPLAEIKVGFSHKWIEDKDQPTLTMVDGVIFEHFGMKKVYFPRTIKARICGSKACLAHPDLLKLIPVEGAPKHLHTPTDRSETFRTTKEVCKDDRPIDPSWLTARGKKLK